MKFTKVFTLLLFVGVLFSCTKDELTTQDVAVTEAADLVVDLSNYVNSPLGMYKGVFSTSDSQERGTVEIKVINDEIAKASITYLNGNVEIFAGKMTSKSLGNEMNIHFFSKENSTFNFSVGEDGSNPTVITANVLSKESLIKIVKENVRGAVVPLTGSFESRSGTLGTWSIIFNTGDGEGDDMDITTQSLFLGTDYGSATGNSQSGCVTTMNTTECALSGEYTTLGYDISWEGVHTYLTTPDCSSASGTWNADVDGVSVTSGTWETDAVCTAPGNFIETAIPIMPSAEGTGCATTSFSVNFEEDGYSNSGIDNSGCVSPPSVGTDIFYTWTATTDALFFQADITTSDEDIVVRNDAGVIIDCANGSSFGGSTLSGWTIGDELVIQIIGVNATADFCLEVATIPGAPANDLCENATPITCGETDSGSTLTATDETGTTGNDVFYSFFWDGETNQVVTVSLCGSSYDTRVRILEGCDGVEIAGNDDNSAACGPGGSSQVTFTASVGVEYIIVVEAFSTQSGSYEIAVTCEDAEIVEFDTCSTAGPIAVGDEIMGTTVGNINTGSTACGIAWSAPDEWYTFTGVTGTLTASLCGSAYDTKLSIWSGDCAALVCVVGNDDSCNFQSEVTFIAEAATTYYVMVHGFSDATGNFTLSLQDNPARSAIDNVEMAPSNKKELSEMTKLKK